VSDLPGIDELKAAGLLDARPATAIVSAARPAVGPATPAPGEDPETGAADAAEAALSDEEADAEPAPRRGRG
jgi:hypothetical protein